MEKEAAHTCLWDLQQQFPLLVVSLQQGRERGRQLRFLLGSQFTQQLWKGERRKSPCVNLRENVQNPKNPGFTHCPASFQLSKLPFGGAASQEQPRLHEEGAVAGQARNKC